MWLGSTGLPAMGEVVQGKNYERAGFLSLEL
jgi:hypothetical protein